MNHSELEELARAIAQNTVVDSWPYWLAMIGLMFVGVFIGALVGSYAARRGEVLAARADRREILDGLRQTTQAAEEVRSAISLGEWTQRERTSLRRAKLEEMLLLAYKAREWLSGELDRILNTDAPEKPSPLEMMMALGRLYFPELSMPLRAFRGACEAHSLMLMAARIQVIQARQSNAGNQVASEQAVARVLESVGARIVKSGSEVLHPLYSLEDAAAALMTQIIAPAA